MKKFKKLWLVILSVMLFGTCIGNIPDGTVHTVTAPALLSRGSGSFQSGSAGKTVSKTKTADKTSITLADIPEYSGEPYTVINDNVPFFSDSDLTTDSFEIYSDLDSSGRCGAAFANISKELMPTGERGKIGSIKPTGWRTAKYPGVVEGNYLYNRCHLIGYQLAGENANKKNLITGTRYLNVDGMLPFENMVADYVLETDNHVLYQVTPIFDGDNLVASGVLIEAESVEDAGSGILFNVFCYNVQPDVIINYKNGKSKLTAAGKSRLQEETPTPTPEPTVQPTPEPTVEPTPEPQPEPVSTGISYIGNSNTGKFHYPNCRSVKLMNDENKVFLNSRDEAVSMGYDPCQNCHP